MKFIKHLAFTLFFFVQFAFSFSQDNKKIDSLVKIYHSSTTDSNKVKALNHLFNQYRYSDEKQCEKYINLSVVFASKTNYVTGYALALYNKGVFEGERGNFDSSDVYIAKSLVQYKKINNSNGVAACNMAFGFNYYDKADFSKALNYFLNSARIKESVNDLNGLSAAYIWIGNVYNNGLRQYNEALSYYHKALKIQEKNNDEVNMAYTYNNIGNVYYFLQQYSLALENHLKSVAIKEKAGNKAGLSSSFDNIGNIYYGTNDLTNAEKFYLKALQIRQEFNDKKGINTSYVNIGNLLLKQKKYDEALKMQFKALETSKLIGNKESIYEAYSSIAECYIALKNYKEANIFLKYSILLKDSILNDDFNGQIAQMQTKYDVEKKDLEISKNKVEIENEKNKRYITYGALGLIFIVLTFVVWAFVQKRKTNQLLEQKNELLQDANQEISHQKEQLSEKQKEILDSINYAQKIQNALLASEEMLMEHLINHFILFKPKDIVSGDFTWATKKDNLFYLACCDSTGHGVPGAFMSLLNIGFLSEAIKERNITEPGKIFDYVRERLIETIGNDDQKDGFDGLLLCINLNDKTITYAAANNSPVIINEGILSHLQVDKMPVGKGIKLDNFRTFKLNCRTDDYVYLFTDGYADQFGGPKGKKFKYKQLEDILLSNHQLPLEQQSQILNQKFEDWRGNLEQVDDVCIIGIKL